MTLSPSSVWATNIDQSRSLSTTGLLLGKWWYAQKLLDFLEDSLSELRVSSGEGKQLVLSDPVRCKSMRIVDLLEAGLNRSGVLIARHSRRTRTDAPNRRREPRLMRGSDIGEWRVVAKELRIHRAGQGNRRRGRGVARRDVRARYLGGEVVAMLRSEVLEKEARRRNEA